MLKLEALGSYKIDYTPVGVDPSPETNFGSYTLAQAAQIPNLLPCGLLGWVGLRSSHATVASVWSSYLRNTVIGATSILKRCIPMPSGNGGSYTYFAAACSS